MNTNATNGNDIEVKFTALLCHPEDKERIKEIREAGGMSEKDTVAAIIDAAWEQKDDIIAGLQGARHAVKAAQIAQRKETYDLTQAAMKKVRDQLKAERENANAHTQTHTPAPAAVGRHR